MKRIYLIFLLLIPFLVFSQESQSIEVKEKYTYKLYAFGGYFFNKESKGFNNSLNFQIDIKEIVWFGVDITRGFYQSPTLNLSPSKDEIANYPDDIDGAVPKVIVNGRDDDTFTGLSLFVAKEFNLGSLFALDIQAGPSIGFIRVHDYNYSYSPSYLYFGGPNFGNSSSVSAKSNETKKTIFSGYARVLLKFKIGKLFRIGISSFANINSEESNSGIQAGFGFEF